MGKGEREGEGRGGKGKGRGGEGEGKGSIRRNGNRRIIHCQHDRNEVSLWDESSVSVPTNFGEDCSI